MTSFSALGAWRMPAPLRFSIHLRANGRAVRQAFRQLQTTRARPDRQAVLLGARGNECAQVRVVADLSARLRMEMDAGRPTAGDQYRVATDGLAQSGLIDNDGATNPVTSRRLLDRRAAMMRDAQACQRLGQARADRLPLIHHADDVDTGTLQVQGRLVGRIVVGQHQNASPDRHPRTSLQ